MEKGSCSWAPRLGRSEVSIFPQLLGSYSHYRCTISSVPFPVPHMSPPRHQSPACSSELPRLKWALERMVALGLFGFWGQVLGCSPGTSSKLAFQAGWAPGVSSAFLDLHFPHGRCSGKMGHRPKVAVPLRCSWPAVHLITEMSPVVPPILAFGILGFHRATCTSNLYPQSPSLPQDWWLLMALGLANRAAPIPAPTSPLQPSTRPPSPLSAFSQPLLC